MPHATTETMTNGDKPSSKTFSRLSSYPAVNDSIETFKSNPYGRKSIEIVDGAYTRFGKPVEPYLKTGYSYAEPYVQKADELADSGLSRVETHFPVVKEDTNTIVDTAKSYIWWPYTYVSDTWQDEYNKTARHNNRGPGVTTSAMALVSTELKIASDFFQAIADFLGPKYEESKKKGADYVKGVEQKASELANNYQENLEKIQKEGQQKAEEAKKQAEEKGQQAKKQAQGAKEEAQKKAQQ